MRAVSVPEKNADRNSKMKRVVNKNPRGMSSPKRVILLAKHGSMLATHAGAVKE
jgi:hypothetical protein